MAGLSGPPRAGHDGGQALPASVAAPSPKSLPVPSPPARLRAATRSRVVLLTVTGLVGLAAVAVVVAVGSGAQRLLAHVVSGADPFTGVPPLLAVVLFVLLYATATVTLVPKPVLNLAAGAWFGLAEGLPLAVAATTLGAATSFALGRAALRGRRFAFLGRRGWSALDRELSDHGFRAVLALRLLPVLPFAAINYGCALGGTRLTPFAAATAFGVLPGTAVLVLAGATASAPSPAGTWVSLAALAVLTCLSLVPRLRRRPSPSTPPQDAPDPA